MDRIYLNAKVSQLLLKCYFLLFEPNILLHCILINKSNDLPSKNMKIRPVRLTIADLQQEMLGNPNLKSCFQKQKGRQIKGYLMHLVTSITST